MDQYEKAYRSDEFANRTLHYKFDSHQLDDLQNETRSLKFPIQTLDGLKYLELEKVNILSSGYTLATEHSIQKIGSRKYKFFRGKVKGEPESKVALSIFKDHIHLVIYDRFGTYEIAKLKDENKIYGGFYSHEQKVIEPFICQTDTQVPVKEKEQEITHRDPTPLECVEIYIEVDHKSYTENGSNIPDVETWTLAIMAQVALFYHDSGIPITVSGIKIYTSTDPYAVHSNTSGLLSAFRDSMNAQGFNGRLAHLFSGRGVGGGRAYLNVLCSNYSNYGVSGNLSSGGTTYNSYTWNIGVVAHELGHNFGSQHTHDCVWNGNSTQIDDCGNVYWYNNNPAYVNSCYDNDNRILPGNQGTIMSYCHVVSGSSINLNLGFHPQVRDRIYANYVSTSCGGQESCVGVAPMNDLCEDAIRLSPTITCNPLSFDNEYATDSGESPAFQCGGPTDIKDVWFVVEIPSNGILDIQTKDITGGLSDMVIQSYTGSCGSFISYSCDDNSGEGNHALISINDNNLANTDLYIRVVEKSGNEGQFGICANSENLPCNSTADSLIQFYLNTAGSNWTNKSGWEDGASGNDCDYCNWYGVSCDINENVIGINLSNNNLLGEFGLSLEKMAFLEELDLSSNNLSGSLADHWNGFPELSNLNLSSNNFSGILPETFNDLASLSYLNAKSNAFTGLLPISLGNISALQYIDLSDNDLEGCFPYYYYYFCYREFADFSNNPNLANGGNLGLVCSSFTGTDYDMDGFCRNIDDCNDFDESIYQGADEICDGQDNNCDGNVDEGMDHGPNVWVGPVSGGEWENLSNWSKGHVPLGCEDVEVGMSGTSIVIDESGGQGNRINQVMRSICVGPNTEVNFGDYCNIQILGSGNINNNGILHMNGTFMVKNTDSAKNGFENSGTLQMGQSNYLYIQNSGVNGLYNKSGGVINNAGTIEIDSNHPVNGSYGIRNENYIFNTGQIYIYGNLKDGELYLAPNSVLESTGQYQYIQVGGFQEGGNGLPVGHFQLPPSKKQQLKN